MNHKNNKKHGLLFDAEPVLDKEFDNGNIPTENPPFFKKIIDILFGRPYRRVEHFIERAREWMGNLEVFFRAQENAKKSKKTAEEKTAQTSEATINQTNPKELQLQKTRPKLMSEEHDHDLMSKYDYLRFDDRDEEVKTNNNGATLAERNLQKHNELNDKKNRRYR